MIIQALKEYYDRKASDPDSDIAPEGFERKGLPFLIVINEEGEFINLEDTRETVNGRLTEKVFLLPRSVTRSGSKAYEKTYLLWDHIGYVLGLPISDKKSALQHQTWLDMLNTLPSELTADKGVAAMRKFYEKGENKKVIAYPEIQECLRINFCNMAFRLAMDVPVPCRDKVREYVTAAISGSYEPDSEEDAKAGDVTGTCMVTGEEGVISRIHGRTPINKDTKSLIGIQKKSGYDSYGKEQAYNAPIIKSTEFAYVTALNTLLKSKTQRMQIGDAVTVFWSERESSFENDFSFFFKEPEKDNPDSGTGKIQALYKSVHSGVYERDDGSMRFCVLGLSPNSARISVRFWKTGTISEFASKIKEYFDDFTIIKPPGEPEYYSVWKVLVNIAVQDRSENIPPNIAGDFYRSILDGIPYPASLLNAVICRIRSDVKRRVTPVRAALIKAYLNRYYRYYPNKFFKEVTMGLDVNQPSKGYQLGRLFAVLEKIQEEANPGINATIRERFYGAACASPVTAFTNLLRLKNHHLAKMENPGRCIYFERLLGEIIGNIDAFPAHLDLHEQGRFAIGYYHQRQAFYTKKEEKPQE